VCALSRVPALGRVRLAAVMDDGLAHEGEREHELIPRKDENKNFRGDQRQSDQRQNDDSARPALGGLHNG